MSIAGGLWRALERGEALGCGAVQIFLKNQRQWAGPPLTPDDVRAFAAARRRTGIRAVFAHASYLINLAVPRPTEWARALDVFTDELERGEALSLGCLVVHPGSHLGAGLEAGLARVAAALDEATRRTAGYRIRIALENTAGGGATLGRRLTELGDVIGRVRQPERVGVCIDTCHLFAAGYDIRSAPGWEAAVAECVEQVGLERVLAFHLNDARAGLGSGLDRHQHIGQGYLGCPTFRRLLTDARFRGVPKVLETPKEPEPLADRRNLARLRALASGSTSPRRAGTARGRDSTSSAGRSGYRRSGRS
ncbi:MAG TPA: deoxyribonuclease IV [Methylomirabilota bacterium]|nr:deoxyribonuclease IV [Methylomirabilota bacterium]